MGTRVLLLGRQRHSQRARLLTSRFNARSRNANDANHAHHEGRARLRAPGERLGLRAFRWHQREFRGLKNSCVAMVTLAAKSPVVEMLSSSGPVCARARVKENVRRRRAGLMNVSARVWASSVPGSVLVSTHGSVSPSWMLTVALQDAFPAGLTAVTQ